MRTFLLALLVLTGLESGVRAAAPLDVWPQQVPAVDHNGLEARMKNIENAANGLPAALDSAVHFQKVFLRILSGEAGPEWRGVIEKFAGSSDHSPPGTSLADVARAWLARAEMADIDTALRNYYRHNVRFPSTFAEVEADIPDNLRKDPWGDPWFYEPRAPRGFDRLIAQRYQLGPGRYPQLGGLATATQNRSTAGQTWQIELREIAGNKALEFRPAQAGASVAMLQPGGKIADCTLVYIGDHWALMAGADQLFAVSF